MFICDNGLIFRLADKADYSEIKNLMETVFQMQVKKENYELYIADKNNQIIVVESENKIIASVCVEKQWNAFTGESILYMRNGAVEDNCRKMGVFTKMNKIIGDMARQERISTVELTCADFREGSQRYYLNHGFTIKKTKVFIREIELEDS